MFAAVASARSVPIPQEGAAARFRLETGQRRVHEISLREGEFLRATVHQQGVDLMLQLLGPGGRVVERDFDSSDGPLGLEPASLLASEAGTYAIEVRAVDETEAGEYGLETEAPRLPDARDRLRLEAENVMQTASRVMGPRAASGRPRPDGTQVTDAIGLYALAIPLWARLDEPCWEAEARVCLALNLTWSLQRESALDNFTRAIDLWEGCPASDYKMAETVLFAGRAFVADSRLRDAAELFDLGLGMSDDPILRLQFLVQSSLVHGQLGDTTRAISYGEEALPLLRERKFAQGTAVVLTHLANAHYRRGELQKASEQAQEALALRRQLGEELGIVATLTALGDIYDALGEPELALTYLEEATEKYAKFATGTAARPRRAAILARIGRREQAREQLLRAVDIARDSFAQGPEAMALLQLAELSVDAGDWEEARANVEFVLAGARRSGDRYVEGQALEMDGRIRLHAGDHAGARVALEASLALRRAVGDREGEATVLRQRARVESAAGDLEAARGLIEAARTVAARQRGLLATPEMRAAWATTARAIDEDHVGVLMDLHRAHPGQGFDALAFEASESASSRSLLESLAERDQAAAEEPASGPVARERAVRERLGAGLDRQLRARQAGLAPEALARADQEVLELWAEHQRAQAEAASRDGGRRAAPEPLRLADVQESLLDADTTLLEFFVGRERGYAWVVGRGRLQAYELPSRARVESAVSAMRAALMRPPRTRRAAGGQQELARLAALLLPQERGLLGGRRLVVVADGVLHYVPFSALPDASGAPLLARFEVTNAPSASVAALLRRRAEGRAPAPYAIAAVADPVYDVRDERLGGRAAARTPDETLAKATRGFDFKDGRLPRLPFTRREATTIAALRPARSRTALDFGANLDAALAPDLSQYRFVHLAAHGLLNDIRPELSGLVLSLVDRKGRARPGLLTAPDVSRLRLNADLVVLSSCRSAVGREVSGEGLVGLTRAFMHAGSPRVVASLWPVDDLASSELMTRMYRSMLGSRKATPAAALRDAQLQVMRDPRWRAPYYWAAFQLQGEWR